MQAFIECYHDSLTDVMKAAGQEAPFELKQFINDFKEKIIYGAIYGIISAPIAILNSADERVSSRDIDDGIEGMLMRARAGVMDTLDSNPMLQPRFLSLIDELMELELIK